MSPLSRERLASLWPVGLVLSAALLGWTVGLLVPVTPSAAPPATPTAATPDEIIVTDQPQPPLSTPVLLPTTAPQLYCFFRLEQVPAGTSLQAQWSLGGRPLGALDLTGLQLDRERFLAGHFTLRPPAGMPQFPPGIYQLTLRSGAEVLIETSFVLAVGAEQILSQKAPPAGEVRVVNLGLFGSLGPQGQPLQPAAVFPPTAKIYAVFVYLNGVPGARLEMRWYANGEEMQQARQPVEMQGGARQGYAWLQASGAGLPEGAYQVQVLLQGNEQPLATVDFTIKAGTVLPPPVPQTPPVVPTAPRR
jgi:hypothetical protein